MTVVQVKTLIKKAKLYFHFSAGVLRYNTYNTAMTAMQFQKFQEPNFAKSAISEKVAASSASAGMQVISLRY